ncbi:MAG: threonine/serine dehydratase, partial [Christensenellales bacterium]
MDDLPDVDTIVVPIGGGGLASGVAAAVKMLHPNVKVIGVQAAGAAGMKASIDAGHVVSLDAAKTIADGIAVKKPGELTFELCSRYLDEIVTVDDDEIAQAILFLMERGKMVAEGAGAAPVAAIMNRKFDVSGKVAAVISGGNIDVTMISRIIEKGLLRAGRMTKLRTHAGQAGQLEMPAALSPPKARTRSFITTIRCGLDPRRFGNHDGDAGSQTRSAGDALRGRLPGILIFPDRTLPDGRVFVCMPDGLHNAGSPEMRQNKFNFC